ncbi:hypothetical protein [Glaciibacter flavus]
MSDQMQAEAIMNVGPSQEAAAPTPPRPLLIPLAGETSAPVCDGDVCAI